MLQARDVGCGLAILFSGINVISASLSGAATITSNNDKLLANMIAWMGNAEPLAGCRSFQTRAGATGQLWYGFAVPKVSLGLLPAEVTALFEWDNPGQAFKFWFRGFPDGFQTLTNVQSYRYYFFQASTAGTPVTP